MGGRGGCFRGEVRIGRDGREIGEITEKERRKKKNKGERMGGKEGKIVSRKRKGETEETSKHTNSLEITKTE